MQRTVSVSSLGLPFAALLLAAATSGCSSASDDDGGGDGTTGAGGSATMGGSSTGGSTTGGSTTGGSTTGGSTTGGDTSTGGSSTGGGTSSGDECVAIASPSGCSGISRDADCAMEGQACPELPCGVSDVGRRECNCTNGVWDCTSCAYPDPSVCSILEPPTADNPLETCSGVSEGAACAANQGDRCMTDGGDVCICWPDDESVVIWDCDSPPSVWN